MKQNKPKREIEVFTNDELVAELEKRGFKWGYVHGHGTDEPASSKDFVIADVEKTLVLIRPEDQFEKPVPYDEYF